MQFDSFVFKLYLNNCILEYTKLHEPCQLHVVKNNSNYYIYYLLLVIIVYLVDILGFVLQSPSHRNTRRLDNSHRFLFPYTVRRQNKFDQATDFLREREGHVTGPQALTDT